MLPFRAAVSNAVWALETVPVDIPNVALVAFAATVTDGGTVKVGAALDASVTVVPPVSAGLVNVTVHVVLAFEPSVDTVHPTVLTVGGADAACNEIVVEAELPFKTAVRVAV